jgi:hypothetical protein
MLVVHFMSSAYGQQIWIFCVSPDFDALVDEKVVNDKIDQSVDEHSNTNSQTDLPAKYGPQGKRRYGNDRKKNKKRIVPFEKRIVVIPDVMVLVQVPKRTVHDVLVHGPGDTFHKYCRNQYDRK